MNHVIMTSKTCAGCKACQAICPQRAIAFVNDDEGFSIPAVDTDKCIECGLCIKTCPALNLPKKITFDITPITYAFQYLDNTVRFNSASGGLFPAFAKYFVEDLKGYVVGCVLDENVMPIHIVSNRWRDVERMQDSKYVQSDMANCMDEVATLLKDGKYVLFTGTSCQCNGLKSLLAKKNVSEEKLLTIDFFCHGVPSPLIWKEYLNFYANEKNVKPVGYRFRCKKYGWGKRSRGSGHLNTFKYLKYSDDQESIQITRNVIREDNWSYISRMWKRIFFSNICLRGYCYNCPYADVNKPSDITMGDLWGIEKFNKSFSDGKGCSLAIVRNNKALDILNKLKNSQFIEVDINNVIKCQANAFNSSNINNDRELFWKLYKEKGFKETTIRFFGNTLKSRLKNNIRRILFEFRLSKYK